MDITRQSAQFRLSRVNLAGTTTKFPFCKMNFVDNSFLFGRPIGHYVNFDETSYFGSTNNSDTVNTPHPTVHKYDVMQCVKTLKMDWP